MSFSVNHYQRYPLTTTFTPLDALELGGTIKLLLFVCVVPPSCRPQVCSLIIQTVTITVIRLTVTGNQLVHEDSRVITVRVRNGCLSVRSMSTDVITVPFPDAPMVGADKIVVGIVDECDTSCCFLSVESYGFRLIPFRLSACDRERARCAPAIASVQVSHSPGSSAARPAVL